MLLAQSVLDDPITKLGLLTGAGIVIAYLFRMLIAAMSLAHAMETKEKNRIIAELESERRSNRQLAAEALQSALDTSNWYREAAGYPRVKPPPAVIPESSSPSTQAQRDVAEMESMKATLALIKREHRQAPRPEPAHAEDLPPQAK